MTWIPWRCLYFIRLCAFTDHEGEVRSAIELVLKETREEPGGVYARLFQYLFKTRVPPLSARTGLATRRSVRTRMVSRNSDVARTPI